MKRTLLIASLACLVACANLAGFSRQPEVGVAGLQLLQLGLLEQRFALQLRIRNPNEVDLPIDGLDFAVDLNGQPFLKGSSNKAVTVPRWGEAVLEVMATSTLGNALKQLRELQKGGRERVDYRIAGRLGVAGVGTLPFERRGDLPLPLLEASPRKPSPPNRQE